MFQGEKLVFGVCLLFLCGELSPAATYVVVNTADSGTGSFRQAIINANANPPPNTISFQITGSPPFTISPLSTLPTLTQPVTIDGTTQTGYAGTPLVQINAAGISASSDCLTLSGGSSSVLGLAIYRSPRDAIRISGSSSNTVAGCYLGTDVTGTNNLGNVEAGVYIYRSSFNVIGGTNAAARNVISGNVHGVEIDDGPTPHIGAGNLIEGNYIGTTYTGTNALGNTNNGVYILASVSNFVGSASVGAQNLISGNLYSGVYLYGAGNSNNVVAGNLIGTDITGTKALGNKLDGITIYGASGNQIGGTNAAGRNILSGNANRGVLIISAGLTNAANNVVQDNYIGTDITGRLAVPNQTNGVIISGVYGNVIGGTNRTLGNLISGNFQNGVTIYQPGASNNIVLGNYIGTDVTGTNALPNTYSGITISAVSGNTVGGTNTGAGNLISGNLQNGVYLQTTNFGGNVVQGNLIGTDGSGRLSVSNLIAGVYIESSGNLIGGALAAARNVISGNFTNGVLLAGVGASNNIIQGNYIGTDLNGTNALPNGASGFYAGVLVSGASANTIGGAGAGNLISGNTGAGIVLIANANLNTIQGNYVGPDVTGTKAITNNGGIYLYTSSTNFIGGTNAGAGNLVSASSDDGIYVAAGNGNVIQGNFIGTKADGVSALGNLHHNIEFQTNASYNLVGGTVPGADNRIAYVVTAQYSGVRIRSGCVGNQILHNSIFSNGGGSPMSLGITVGNAGVTTNGLPVFTNAITGNGTLVRGSLFSTPSTTFMLQLYANTVTNASGYGEGLEWLATTNITTDATGNTRFSVLLATNVPAGQYLSATVTDSTNNTSEFAADIKVLAPPIVGFAASNYIASIGSNYNNTLTYRTNRLTHRITTNVVGWVVFTNYGRNFYLTWPTNPPGFSVLQATSLAPAAVWSPFTNQPALQTNIYKLLLPTTNGGSGFYRLMLP